MLECAWQSAIDPTAVKLPLSSSDSRKHTDLSSIFKYQNQKVRYEIQQSPAVTGRFDLDLSQQHP